VYSRNTGRGNSRGGGGGLAVRDLHDKDLVHVAACGSRAARDGVAGADREGEVAALAREEEAVARAHGQPVARGALQLGVLPHHAEVHDGYSAVRKRNRLCALLPVAHVRKGD
jgi:hypothetical protein